MSDTNLYQRNGVWWGRVQIAGRDQRRSLHTTVKREATARLKVLLVNASEIRAAALVPDAPVPEPEKTWEDAVLLWHDLHSGDLKPAALKRYMVSLRQLDAHLKGPVANITETTIADYVLFRKQGGTSSATIRRDLTLVSRVLHAAKRRKWITANPVADEKAELKERKDVIRPVPTRHIVATIRASADGAGDLPGVADLIRFAARTGCRQDEARSLAWPQLDVRNRTATFLDTKTGAPRVIKLTQRTARWLNGLKRGPAAKDGQRYVFWNEKGGPLSCLPNRYFRAVARAGVPHHRFHDLRHNYAIRRLQADEGEAGATRRRTDDQARGIYALSRHLGHSTVRTTEGYLRFMTGTTRA